jgi:hypothetical protein
MYEYKSVLRDLPDRPISGVLGPDVKEMPMTSLTRQPVEDLIKDVAISAYDAMEDAIALATTANLHMALEGAQSCQSIACRARKIMIAALKRRLFSSQNCINVGLGHAEDARLFANAASIFARYAAQRIAAPTKPDAEKATAESMGLMLAAIRVLVAAIKTECTRDAMKKAATAVTRGTGLPEEAAKAGDPCARDASAAVTITKEINVRVRWLGMHGERKAMLHVSNLRQPTSVSA